MFNALLDPLPTEYEGYLIRTDYRIGVQIQLCLSDPELSDYERTAIALNLLYGRGTPDFETAIAGLGWFMSCGKTSRNDGDSGPDVWSFEHDDARIVSAFQKVFRMDVTREKLHWFQFVPMLHELSGTAFADVIDIRKTDPNDVDQKRRAELIRLKERFALPVPYDPEEQARIEEFTRLMNGG